MRNLGQIFYNFQEELVRHPSADSIDLDIRAERTFRIADGMSLDMHLLRILHVMRAPPEFDQSLIVDEVPTLLVRQELGMGNYLEVFAQLSVACDIVDNPQA